MNPSCSGPVSELVPAGVSAPGIVAADGKLYVAIGHPFAKPSSLPGADQDVNQYAMPNTASIVTVNVAAVDDTSAPKSMIAISGRVASVAGVES